MNILFIAHHDGLSGANQSLVSLLDGLHEYPVKLFVVAPKEGALTNVLIVRAIPYKIVPIVYWITDKKLSIGRKIQIGRDIFRSVQIIRTLVKEWDIDIIYTNTSVSPVGRIAAILDRVPHIWHFRELAELHFSWKFIFPRFISLVLIQNSAAVISVCKAVMDYYFKPGANHASVVYNGIATKEQYDVLYHRKHKMAIHDGYVFAIIGSITQQKGQQIAIKAIMELHKRGLPVKLVIAGSGKLAAMEYLKELVENLGLSSFVEFTGQINDSYQVYFASDCLLMCSDFEGLSRVTIEAMSACLPVIGKNSGGTPEIIQDEKIGLLYNTFDELVAAMTRMVDNPGWGREMGLAGWSSAKERFNVENYAANVYKVIQSVSRVKSL